MLKGFKLVPFGSDPYFVLFCIRLWIWLAKSISSFGEVDTHGAPGDAASAADTSGCSKLINPGC